MKPELKEWFRNTFIEMMEYEFGVYPASADLYYQTKSWQCFGCIAVAITSYPKWGKPDFIHHEGCRYLEFMAELQDPR
jgi:hypothetical protein